MLRSNLSSSRISESVGDKSMVHIVYSVYKICYDGHQIVRPGRIQSRETFPF